MGPRWPFAWNEIFASWRRKNLRSVVATPNAGTASCRAVVVMSCSNPDQPEQTQDDPSQQKDEEPD